MKLPNYKVIRDSKEKVGHGWFFEASVANHRPPKCDGTIIQPLKTGDYTLINYEDILSIERKKDFSELWGNYSADRRYQFEEEMIRMSDLKYAYVLIESNFNSDIMKLSPPQFSKGVPGKALVKWLVNLAIKYNINIIPVGSCGHKMAQFIFEEVVRVEKI